MKGVILAGGTGSRLRPLTKAVNKSMLPMGRQTIIEHVLDVHLKAGIRDIMLVSGPEHFGMLAQLLGSGKDHGCKLTYRVQDEANGIAAALGMCKDFVGDDKFAVILGDNIFEHPEEAARCIKSFASTADDYALVVKEVPDPERFGVVKYSTTKGVPHSIIEKPLDPPSKDAVLGLYMYTPVVFDIISRLTPSARGEFEISDVNNELTHTKVGNLYRIQGGWVDAGTHESYQRACTMILNSESGI